MTAFTHQHTAHCESGVMSALLTHHGCAMNEAMVFGLAHALTFVYLPVVKLNSMPLISYRIAPRGIIKNVCRALGVKLDMRKFAQAERGAAALDEALLRGQIAGLQTSVYWLPYFPPEMRFHFNAHNLLVYGRENGSYLISDPVFETVQRCPAEDLQRARFAKGALAPKGMMYTLDDTGNPAALPEGIRFTNGKKIYPAAAIVSENAVRPENTPFGAAVRLNRYTVQRGDAVIRFATAPAWRLPVLIDYADADSAYRLVLQSAVIDGKTLNPARPVP